MKKLVINILGCTGILLASANVSGAPLESGVTINGQTLSSAELVSVQTRLNTRIAPGHYLVDPHSGCWLNIKTGRTGCIGDPGIYPSQGSNGKGHQTVEKDSSSNVPSQDISVTSDSIDHASNWSSR